MNALPVERNNLSDDQIFSVLDDAGEIGITAVEWLGGEPLLRKSILDLMNYSRKMGLRNNLWTGGLPLKDQTIREKVIQLCQNGLISVHVSSVTPEIYKKLHPDNPVDNLHEIIEAVEAMLQAGYPPSQLLNSVTFTGLQPAEDMIKTIDFFEENFGMATSLNVYHTYLRPEEKDEELEKYIPRKSEVVKVYKRYARQLGMKEVPMNCVDKKYCSATLALLYDGRITPCATIRPLDAPKLGLDGSLQEIAEKNKNELLFAKFKEPDNLPDSCQSCHLSDVCWGCRSRAYAAGMGVYGPDPRCFRNV